jgi:two-component system response regulator YesN
MDEYITKPIDMNELFHTPEELELYRFGMRSVDQMKKLIHHVANHYSPNTQPVDQGYLVKQVIQYINEHLEDEIHRDDLADHVHLNADYLTRIFKKETGQTLKEYVIEQKIQEAKSLLRTTNLPVSIIAAKVGYCNFSHFSYTYKKIMGITPQEERQETSEEAPTKKS